mgnify:CR=1 FL=1
MAEVGQGFQQFFHPHAKPRATAAHGRLPASAFTRPRRHLRPARQDTWDIDIHKMRLVKLLGLAMVFTHLFACMSYFVQVGGREGARTGGRGVPCGGLDRKRKDRMGVRRAGHRCLDQQAAILAPSQCPNLRTHPLHTRRMHMHTHAHRVVRVAVIARFPVGKTGGGSAAGVTSGNIRKPLLCCIA